MSRPGAVLLLSGGLDSYTAGALMQEQGYALHALSVLYGQRHAREIEAARAVAARLGVERHIELAVDLRRFGGAPHAGFGMGFERLVLFATGVANVRDTIAFPRVPGRCAM